MKARGSTRCVARSGVGSPTPRAALPGFERDPCYAPLCPFAPCRLAVSGAHPTEGDQQAVRRYELMLVLKPDAPDERAAAVIDRTTRYVVAQGGQIVKVA